MAFSEQVMDHYRTPRCVGDLPDASGTGLAGSMARGQFVRLQVRLAGQRVEAARYRTYGCVPALAAGSWACEWVQGRTTAEARSLDASRLEQGLGGLPAGRRFCAALAVEALQRALEDAERSQADAD